MSEIAEFTRHLGHYLASPDIALVERAFEFSESAHRGQFRKSGEPFITHPLAVASILSEWRLDAEGLAAALLHDVMEDTSVTRGEIETTFGKPVAAIVDGLSKLDQIEAPRADSSRGRAVAAATRGSSGLFHDAASIIPNVRPCRHSQTVLCARPDARRSGRECVQGGTGGVPGRAMNERMARDVVLVRAIEATDGARDFWSDADRAWAGRAAAEIVGEKAPDDALSGAARRWSSSASRSDFRKLARCRGCLRRVAWLAPVAAIAAFVIGAAGVDVGPAASDQPARAAGARAARLESRRIRGAARRVGRVARIIAGREDRCGEPSSHGSRDVARPVPRKSGVPRALAVAFAQFAASWPALAMPLWQQRAARLLHVGCRSARARRRSPGSTFAASRSNIAPAGKARSSTQPTSRVSCMSCWRPAHGSPASRFPAADRLHAIAGRSAGENAAPWIHLYAATLLLVVIVPRLALAGAAWMRGRRLAATVSARARAAYFQRLLHAWREGTARVVAAAVQLRRSAGESPKASRN